MSKPIKIFCAICIVILTYVILDDYVFTGTDPKIVIKNNQADIIKINESFNTAVATNKKFYRTVDRVKSKLPKFYRENDSNFKNTTLMTQVSEIVSSSGISSDSSIVRVSRSSSRSSKDQYCYQISVTVAINSVTLRTASDLLAGIDNHTPKLFWSSCSLYASRSNPGTYDIKGTIVAYVLKPVANELINKIDKARGK